MLKRFILAISIVLLFSISCYAAPVDAPVAPAPAGYRTLSNATMPADYSVEDYTALMETYAELIEFMHIGMEAREEEIFIDEYYLPESVFSALYYIVVNRGADLFDLTDYCHYSLWDGYVYSFMPVYTMTNEEYEDNKSLYNMYIEELLHLGDGDLTDVEKILHLHDFMASHYHYDTYYETGSAASTAFGLMNNKTGVCRAYCIVFEEILLRWGIPCITATSSDMAHAWNMVELDGQWYHVDLTWDDAVPDFIGQTYHHFLLLDDATMQDATYNQNIHYNWVADHTATDKTYVNYFWDDNRAPFRYIGGKWYHIKLDTTDFTTGLYEVNFQTHEKTRVHATKNIWLNWTNPNRYYISTFSGIDTYDDWIIFNDAVCLYAYHPDTKEVKVLLDVTGSDKGYIYGSYIDDHVLYYGQTTEPTQGCSVTGKIDLCPLFENIHCELAYNANGGNGIFHTIPTCVSYTATITSSTPSRPFHEFLGWAKTPAAAKPELFAGDKIIMEGNLTLYAVWAPRWELSARETSSSFIVTAESEENSTAYLFVTFYDEKGRLLSVAKDAITTKKSKSIKKPSGAKAGGAFVWTDIPTLSPGCTSIYQPFDK